MKKIPIVIAVFLFCLQATPGLAHGVYIFAWPDGPRICTESYFSKSSKVRGGKVNMRDARGRVLDSGTTDEQGLACFPAPATPQDLSFEVLAGEGHRGEFQLPAQSRKQSEADAAPKAQAETPPAPGVNPPAQNAGARSGLSEADYAALREMVRQELQSQLGPLRQTLAEGQADAGPRPRDVIGGIGWLLGLAGLLAWLRVRRAAKVQGQGDA